MGSGQESPGKVEKDICQPRPNARSSKAGLLQTYWMN